MKRIILSASVAALVLGASVRTTTAAGGGLLTSDRQATIQPQRAAVFGQRVQDLKADVARDRSPARIFGQLGSALHPAVGRELGIVSSADLGGTELGHPIPVFFVRLDELKAYGGGQSNALLRDVSLAARLVRVGGTVRSSVLQSNAKGTWETVQMGDQTRAIAIDSVMTSLEAIRGVSKSDVYLVKVPALGLDFVGFRGAAGAELAPLFDAPEHGLLAGNPVTQDGLFTTLASAAKTVSTQPSSRN